MFSNEDMILALAGQFTLLSHEAEKFISFILDVLFGVWKGEDFKILNHLILSAKFYIYKCKLSGVNPSLQVFKVKTKVVHQIERNIAAKRDKLKKHNEKWMKLEPYVSE